MKDGDFLFKKQSVSAENIQLMWRDMGPGHHPADLTPGSRRSAFKRWKEGLVPLPGMSDAFCYLKFKFLICFPRKTEDKTRTAEKWTVVANMRVRKELQRIFWVRMLNYILMYSCTSCKGLSNYRWQKRSEMKEIIPNKLKCYVTFNARNKFSMWNMKKEIHFN